MFAFTDRLGPVDLAFTDRHGGVSSGPWSTLNLGASNGDDPDRVTQNLRRVADGVGASSDQLVWMGQQHGRVVYVADDDSDMMRSVPEADAIVTRTPGLALLARVADCTPVVLADPESGVVAVVHAGRKGMVCGVVDAAVGAMRRLGAAQVTAWVGPRACGRCYEVPAQMRDDVAAQVPEARSRTSWGTPALDVGAGVVAQLARAGVDVVDLAVEHSACTIEDERYFSYRRQGRASGRSGALVRLSP